MSAPRASLLRRALAMVALVAALLGAGGAVAGAQAPSTGDAATTTTEAATGGADEAAQAEADEDLRAVWEVVAALGAVAVGLLVLLVLYVRATNPTRAALRRKARVVNAEHRREGRQKRARSTGGGLLPVAAADLADDEPEPEDEDELVEEPVPVAAAVPAAEPTVPLPGPPPPPRPRRVQAPAKKLATPDAERVLVRPGQAPIRVPPPAAPRTDGPPPPAPDR